jgi:hypothetical protein
MRFAPPPKIYITLLAGIFGIAGILILFLFPVQHSSTLWTGYRILAVPIDRDEKNILSALDHAGIHDYVSESNSRLVPKDSEAPIIPFLDTLNVRRSLWFVNEKQKTRYFFLPDSGFLDSRLHTAFSGTEIEWKIEKSDGFSPLPVILVAIMLGIGLITVKNRWIQFVCGFPFIILAASYNQMPGFIASIFAVVFVILASGLLYPAGTEMTVRQSLNRAKRQPLVFIPAGIALSGGICGGFHGFFLFIAASAVAVALLISGMKIWKSLIRYRNRRRIHPVFIPLVIDAGNRADYFYGMAIRLSAAAVICTCVGVFFFTAGTSVKENGMPRELYIPVPTGYTSRTGFGMEGYTALIAMKKGTELPDLTDYVAADWNMRTFPWRKIREPLNQPVAGDTMAYTRYSMDDSGRISGKTEILDTFDAGFIRKALSADITPLEKMLLRQNRFVIAEMTRQKK